MEWKTINSFEQIDTVGNIYQKQGGVIPKACQKCKKKFDSKVKEIPIFKYVVSFSCKDCKLNSGIGQEIMEHNIEHPKHKLKKIKTKRLVQVEKQLVGNKSNIEKTKDDVIILCDECLD